jgi:hypothetical protein
VRRGDGRGRRLVLAALAAAGAAALAWAVGVDGGHVATLGLAAGVLVGVVGLLPLPGPLDWPEDEPPSSGAGWHQVALLAGVLGQTDRDPDRVGATRARLRTLAAQRLSRAGIAWDDPRAVAVLGRELHDVLDDRRPAQPATALTRAVLDALDTLEVAPADEPR